MKKLRFAFRYFNYLLKAGNEHSVHSPFVFDLLLNVIYVKTDYYVFKDIENIRQQLLNSDKTISYTSYGVNTNEKNAPQIKIKNLAKHSAKPAKYGQLLFRLVNHFQPAQVLELGTSLGISTAYLASANSKINVITIEGSKQLATIAGTNFKQLKLNNVKQVTGNFENVLPPVIDGCKSLDFVFFDGNHRKEPTLNYFNLCLQKANESSVFVVDDIYWSKEMAEAWKEIKNNDSVTITIDLFFMGLVFFRKTQAKQHFIIRF